jgi:hypothetical protein
MTRETRCPVPSILPVPSRDTVALASQVSHAANEYRATVDENAGFRAVITAANRLARLASELATAVADSAS